MRIVVDERERDLYEKLDSIVNFQGFSTTIQLCKKVLPLGDILIQTDGEIDVLLIERKSLADLLASIKDGRYEEQSYRLIHSSEFSPHNIVYIIEGMLSQLRTFLEKKTLYSALTSLHFFKGFSTFRTCSLQETAEHIVWMTEKIERDFHKGKIPAYVKIARHSRQPMVVPENTHIVENTPLTESAENSVEQIPTSMSSANYCTVVKKVKKDNVTPENIGEIVLCQIPGVSSVTAMAIMKKYKTFPNLIDNIRNRPEEIENIVCENNGKMRKISKSCAKNIVAFLGGKEGEQITNNNIESPILP